MRRPAFILNARTSLGIAAILLLVVALAPPARGNLGAEGEPTFGISGWFKTLPRLNQPTTLLVRIWGGDASEHPITSAARISVPEGIELVSGDTVSVVRADRRSRRRTERVVQLVIRPSRYGTFVIRGRLAIDGGEEHGSDETDFELPLTLEADSLIAEQAPRMTRYENVRHGQRYRYAGRYLVPIDSTQALLEEEITEKPKPTAQDTAFCHSCPGPLPTVVPFVVMVGRDGRIRDSWFLDMQEEGTVDPALVAVASAALARWPFQPAKAGERPVADYVVVRVPVRDGQP
jgi:hypothetical protein